MGEEKGKYLRGVYLRERKTEDLVFRHQPSYFRSLVFHYSQSEFVPLSNNVLSEWAEEPLGLRCGPYLLPLSNQHPTFPKAPECKYAPDYMKQGLQISTGLPVITTVHSSSSNTLN